MQKPDDQTAIGEGVKIARKRAGLTQKQLGELVGLGQSAIGMLETGNSKASTKIVEIAKALGVTPESLRNQAGAESNIPMSRRLGTIGIGATIQPAEGRPAALPLPAAIGEEDVFVEIKGVGAYPFQDGWRLFFDPRGKGVPPAALDRLCIVKVMKGPLLLRTVRRGRAPKTYRLEAWNEPPREDVSLEWAARVKAIITA